MVAVARLGTAPDYEQRFNEFESLGVRLIHTPAEYQRTSELPTWYSLLKDLTPRSVWFDHKPASKEVEQHFQWPVFVKGQRQTNRHNKDTSIIDGAKHFESLMTRWDDDEILRWQKVVCREFVPLRPVGPASVGFPKSYEFRTFCWRGECVAVGRYWVSESFAPTDGELKQIRDLAEEAARRLNVVFVVIDIAQTVIGDWIVIECNDGQDSGYAGVSPLSMWRRIIDIERQRI